jgi:hypothetical protein
MPLVPKPILPCGAKVPDPKVKVVDEGKPPPDAATVWFGQLPLIVTFDPGTREGVETPVPPLVTDTGVLRDKVTLPLVPPPDNPVPAVTPVMVPDPPPEEFTVTIPIPEEGLIVTFVPATIWFTVFPPVCAEGSTVDGAKTAARLTLPGAVAKVTVQFPDK